MDDEAVKGAVPAPGAGEEGGKPYSPPCLTSYGSLPIDTAGIGVSGSADFPVYTSI